LLSLGGGGRLAYKVCAGADGGTSRLVTPRTEDDFLAPGFAERKPTSVIAGSLATWLAMRLAAFASGLTVGGFQVSVIAADAALIFFGPDVMLARDGCLEAGTTCVMGGGICRGGC